MKVAIGEDFTADEVEDEEDDFVLAGTSNSIDGLSIRPSVSAIRPRSSDARLSLPRISSTVKRVFPVLSLKLTPVSFRPENQPNDRSFISTTPSADLLICVMRICLI